MANEDSFHLGIKALIQNENSELLLLKVNVRALRGDASKKEPYWDIPGGRLHINDNIESTLRREIHEETGISDIKSVSFFSAALSNIRIPLEDGGSEVGLILFMYLCETNDNVKITLSDEHIAYAWFTPKDAATLLEVKYPQDFLAKLKTL